MKRESHTKKKITRNIYDGVRALDKSGMTTKQIADAFSIGKSTVRFIIRSSSFEEYKRNQNPNTRQKAEIQFGNRCIYQIEFFATEEELRHIVDRIPSMVAVATPINVYADITGELQDASH